MDWLILNNEQQLAVLHEQSFNSNNKGILLFKHSTRCSISDVALNRLERAWEIPSENLPAYYLDLLNYKAISSEIATKYTIPHESPQVLIIKNGICIYTASHTDISLADIQTAILDS